MFDARRNSILVKRIASQNIKTSSLFHLNIVYILYNLVINVPLFRNDMRLYLHTKIIKRE
jgi:hypothetical protein